MITIWLWLLLGAMYPSLTPHDATHLAPGGMVEKARSLPPAPTDPSEKLKSERVQEAES